MEENRFIHLLYVPTMCCNMECKYCYLEDRTQAEEGKEALETLQYAIEKFRKNKVIPFNISLHGGEVTTLSKEVFEGLIAYISEYYALNKELIESNGFRVNSPHIKTNLYRIDQHIDTIKKYNVSVSGSLDIPFSLHDEFRVTKGGQKTLEKILQNIRLMQELPNRKKVSATIFKEHYDRLDEMMENIEYLHQHTCLDMNDFNFMIGFAFNSNGLLTPLTQEGQVDLYRRMHTRFDGTQLDAGVNGAWFNEFGPDYCTNCVNCGDKFFLLEKNGDIYSCVRGQKQVDFYYGNIYTDTVETILENARSQIFKNHNKQGFNEECGNCPYLYICKTGCPFVKKTYNSNQSYTCLLQQEMYKDRHMDASNNVKGDAYEYTRRMHPQMMAKYIEHVPGNTYIGSNLTELIDQDRRLRYIYDANSFYLTIDGTGYALESQILRDKREIVWITQQSEVLLHMKKSLLDEECDYPNNNSLYMMCLSGNLISYGDEGRTKQEHVFTHQIFMHALQQKTMQYCEEVAEPIPEDEYVISIGPLLNLYADSYDEELPNNLFFTTSALRDYHYTKQKNNAFYHVQAINLPFQNIEFMYLI